MATASSPLPAFGRAAELGGAGEMARAGVVQEGFTMVGFKHGFETVTGLIDDKQKV